MTKTGLPRPVTTEQEYLAAILVELRAIRLTLSPDSPTKASGEVELKEPRRKRAKEA